jgi:acyl carrier protein phosphodiesterase
VGNMVSDFVKGREKFVFSGNIQKGIELHRYIDEYTDLHPATKKAIEIFRPHYRLYSAPLMDILFDHFLANDPNLFNDRSLKEFSKTTYHHLENNSTDLPNKFLQVLLYMKSEDWLYNYSTVQGIRKSLYGLARRATYLYEVETAYNLFLKHYDYLNECYHNFFPDVKQFAKQKFEQLVL